MAPADGETANGDNEAVSSRADNDEEVVSVSKSLSRTRLTLEEIIADDNDASRRCYLSPTSTQSVSPTSPALPVLADDDVSSVSSTFGSEMASARSSSTTLDSTHSSSTTLVSTHSLPTGHPTDDPFRGIDEEDFARLDRYGFMVVSLGGSASMSEMEFAERERKRIERDKETEARRALKWVEMLKELEGEPSVNQWPRAHGKFLSRLVKGIPDCLRMRVWSRLLETRGLYETGTSADAPDFAGLYLRVSGFERQIDLDIERTLRDHVLFKIRYSQAQISLFKILVAHANLDPEVGYCQGMSTVAAFLLLYFDESRAFSAFARLLQRDDLRLLYQTGFPLLFEYFWIQERLLGKFVPELARHLERHGITTSIYATKWYLTLFLSFPIRLAARIWDLFLFYGLDVLLLVAVSLLRMHARVLVTLSFEQTMQYLNRLADAPDCACPDRLLRSVMRLGRKYFGDGPFDGKHARGFVKYRRAWRNRS